MSKCRPRCLIAIALHSICQPGRPGPQGEGQAILRDGQLRRGPEIAAQREPILARHHDIQHEHIRRAPLQQPAARRGAFDRAHPGYVLYAEPSSASAQPGGVPPPPAGFGMLPSDVEELSGLVNTKTAVTVTD